MTVSPLRIAVIAPVRYPISQPHAGGLESALWNRVATLRDRGHRVTLCAVDGSDFLDGGPAQFRLPKLHWPDPSIATDITYPPGYLALVQAAQREALEYLELHARDFDLIDNHCLHGLPLEWADRIALPMVTSLHTPVLPEIVEAYRASSRASGFLAVSSHTAREWADVGIHAAVLPNAIDTDLWGLGRGGDAVVWFGRIVPEKGPHLAIDAARLAGRRIVLAGRIGDHDYADREVWPRLGDDAVYLGELAQAELATVVGSSACVVATPIWEEPFGLVLAEAAATGTPVVAFETGGVPEVLAGIRGSRMVPTGDVAAMAAAIVDATGRSTMRRRRRTRRDTVDRFALSSRIVQLEEHYRRIIAEQPVRAVARP